MPIFGAPNAARAKAKGDIKALVAMLSYKKDKNVRKEAAEALDQLGWKPTVDEAGAWYWYAKDALKNVTSEFGSSACEPLLAALQDEQGNIRAQAAETLGKICDRKATPALIAALKDADDKVERNAIRALGELGDPRSIDALIQVLNRPLGGKSEVIDALARFGDARAIVPFLREFEVYGNVQIGANKIAAAPGMLNDKQLRFYLTQSLLNGLKNPMTTARIIAIFVLGEIGDERVKEQLEFSLRTQETREFATKALEKIEKRMRGN